MRRIAFFLVLGVAAWAEDKPDCDADPLAQPKMELTGDVEADAGHVHVAGKVQVVESSEGEHHITLEPEGKGKVTLTLVVPADVPLDVTPGRDVEVDLWSRQGFEGRAIGVRIRDVDRVVAIRSVARVGDVRWTDAPYEEVSFAIGRVPKD